MARQVSRSSSARKPGRAAFVELRMRRAPSPPPPAGRRRDSAANLARLPAMHSPDVLPARAARVCARLPSDNPTARRRCAPRDAGNRERDRIRAAGLRHRAERSRRVDAARDVRITRRRARQESVASARHTRCWNSVPPGSSGRSSWRRGASMQAEHAAPGPAPVAQRSLHQCARRETLRADRASRVCGESPSRMAQIPLSLVATSTRPERRGPEIEVDCCVHGCQR